MTKLLATGDSHIGARPDLGLKPGERLAEQQAVWDWTLQQARDHEVDAIVYAGDAFEQRRPDPETMLAFERPLVQHRAAGGPPVYAIVGNHDVSSQDTGTALDVFAQAGLLQLERTPRVVLTEGPCLLACLPWAPTSRLAASMNGSDRDRLNEDASRLLVDVADQLYLNALKQRGAPIVLLTHFSISGTSLPSGLDVGQLHEPVLNQDDLRAIGYDVIVAGHIHRPQLFDESGKIGGFYVGSPMPLSFGEADGAPRGPSIISFGTDGYVTIEHLPAPSRRFFTFTYKSGRVFETMSDPDDDIGGAFVKLRVAGTEEEIRQVDLVALKAGLEEAGAYRVFVETQVERAARARDATVDDTISEDDALDRWLASQNGAVSLGLAARARERARGYFERVRS